MRWLKIKQLDEKIGRLKLLTSIERPQEGWLRTIREALGMTLEQVGRKLNISKSSVLSNERSEKEYSITLAQLEKVAEVLGCRVVYTLIPYKPVQEMVDERINTYAGAQIQMLSHTMLLEEQQTQKEHLEMEKQVIIDRLKRQKNISIIWEAQK